MRLKKKDDDIKIIILGIILAGAVIVLGFVSYYGVNHYLTKVEEAISSAEDARLSEEMREEIHIDGYSSESTDVPAEPVATAVPPSEATGPTVMPGIEVTPQITGMPQSDTAPAYYYLTTRASADLSPFVKANITDSSASSVYVKENFGEDNSAAMLYDGKDQTSWKEGADGRGEGEAVYLKFDKQYNISRITLKLGNWYNYSYWVTTCRPKGLTMWFDGVKYEFVFPDGMTEYCIVFAKEVPASEVTIRLDSVYINQNTNSCISEIEFYGSTS